MKDESSASIQPATISHTSPVIQFRLSTMFVLTLVASLLAAFVQPYGNDMMLAALVTTVTCLILAIAIGARWPPMTDRAFWGVVVAAMMQAVAATVILYDRSGIYAWPIAAGVGGILSVGPGHRYRHMLMSAAGAALVITIYMFAVHATLSVLIANVVCAMIGGALLALLVELAGWVETKKRVPQSTTAIVLTISSMAFATVAANFIPGW